MSGLASAVANEGGIGVIATAAIGMQEPDFAMDFLAANTRALRREIKKARQLTPGIIRVNIMVALSNFADMTRTAVEEEVDIIFSGAGLPGGFIPAQIERKNPWETRGFFRAYTAKKRFPIL